MPKGSKVQKESNSAKCFRRNRQQHVTYWVSTQGHSQGGMTMRECHSPPAPHPTPEIRGKLTMTNEFHVKCCFQRANLGQPILI